jgi:hypothetical protein
MSMSSACGHAEPRTIESEARLQHQFVAGAGPRRQWKKVGGWLLAARVAVSALLLLGALRGSASAQDAHLIVITGVGGDDEHSASFHKLATAMIDAAAKKDGVPEANIIYLGEKPEVDPARIKLKSSRENVEKTLSDLAARARPNDAVLVLLIGHGSFDGRQAAFNLPGPDLTPTDFTRLLGKLATQRVAFVNTASSSGAFLPTLAAPNRVVVTATKTGGERNETRFPEFFVEAFGDDAADRDRNGRVSLQEAFDYAKAKVTKTYEQQGLLLSEHATLDDGANGSVASSLFLAASQTGLKVDTSDPAMRKLVEERDAIEKQIAGLKLMKPSMDGAQYDTQMEKLLTDLAVKTKQIRDLQAKKDPKE